MSSDTQFSSLSPNSSCDIDLGNRQTEENDFYDQETLTITSNKSVANLNDFDDEQSGKGRIDPFLSEFMYEENDDLTKPQLSTDNLQEQIDYNMFNNSPNTENGIDEGLFAFNDNLEEIPTNLLDLDTIIFQRQISSTVSNKRAFSPIDNVEFSEMPSPSKQRRVEVSSHVRCDEWINKYHEVPDNFALKASGILDRRKTKHHKVLNEFDSDSQIENIGSKVNRASLLIQKSISNSENTPLTFSPHVVNSQMSLSLSSTKVPTICSLDHIIRKPFIHHNNNNQSNYSSVCKDIDTHITDMYHEPNSPVTLGVTLRSSAHFSSSGSSRALSDIVEMPRIPPPLKMGKRISRRGHRLSLWQFLMCLLDSYKYREHSTGIKWLNRNNGVFHIVDSKQVATLWGQYKERRDKMTYDSLARSLRHYYKKNLMAKINNRRLVYQIAQECIQWSTDTFVKRQKE